MEVQYSRYEAKVDWARAYWNIKCYKTCSNSHWPWLWNVFFKYFISYSTETIVPCHYTTIYYIQYMIYSIYFVNIYVHQRLKMISTVRKVAIELLCLVFLREMVVNMKTYRLGIEQNSLDLSVVHKPVAKIELEEPIWVQK